VSMEEAARGPMDKVKRLLAPKRPGIALRDCRKRGKTTERRKREFPARLEVADGSSVTQQGKKFN